MPFIINSKQKTDSHKRLLFQSNMIKEMGRVVYCVIIEQAHIKLIKKRVKMEISGRSLSYGILMGLGLTSAFRLYAGSGEKEKGGQYEDKMKFVGIEIGEDSYNVAIGEPIINNKGEISGFVIIKRRNGMIYESPDKSFDQIIKFLKQNQEALGDGKNIRNVYRFIGVASIGPICLDKSSQYYGSIINSERQLWRGANIYDLISKEYPNIPTQMEIHVNALAYAEFKLGKHQVKESLAYVTVGNTVEVGIIAQGKPVHGLLHPNGGHIMVERSPYQHQDFKGACPYHKNRACLSGMISNKAIADRLKIGLASLADIQDDSHVWRLIAFYIAQLCLNITLLLSPEIIIISGGIMNRKSLFLLIHEQFLKLQQGYSRSPAFDKARIQRYITSPKLGDDSGIKGAMILSSLTP